MVWRSNAEVSSKPSWVWVLAKQNDRSCRSCMQSELKTNWILTEKVSLAHDHESAKGVEPQVLLAICLFWMVIGPLNCHVPFFSSSFSGFSHDLLLAIILVISSCFTVFIFLILSMYLFRLGLHCCASFSLLVVSRACSSCGAEASLQWLLLLQSTGSGAWGLL